MITPGIEEILDTALLQEEEPKPNTKQLTERYDGRAKVTGKAKYAAEFTVKNPAYAWIVQSTIPNGSITAIDQAAAAKAPGVLAILTPFNAPKLPKAKTNPPASRHITTLQEPDVWYNGQPIAVVVAETLDRARYAASLLKITYKQQPAKLDFKGRLSEARPPKQPGREPADETRGNLQAGLAKAAVKVDTTYTTPIQNHNPMEPHATIASWEGDKLHVYDSTQYITGVKMALAKNLGIPLDNVHVQCPYTGGGFGSKGSTWSHVILCAMAAKVVNRPVKLSMDRTQMFGPVGARPTTIQTIRLGAMPDGKLTAIEHKVIMHTSVMEDFTEPSAMQTRLLYNSESNVTSHRLVDVNLGVATFQRAPGEATGTAALECALDELAWKLKMDPLDLRLANYAERDPGKDRPFTSKHLREAYTKAADQFGWSKRPNQVAATPEGNNLIGWGMATATYGANRSAAMAICKYLPDGRGYVGVGSQDLGTGTYTIMADTAAHYLGLDPKQITAELGDSTLPKAPVSGGSQSAASIGPAIQAAAMQAKLKLGELAKADTQSPLHGINAGEMDVKDGKLFAKAAPDKSESIQAILTRNGGKPVEAMGSAEAVEDKTAYTPQSFGAVFVEVAVDKDTHMVKVRRVVACYDIGILMNQKTGTHQLVGGIVWGISTALHEETHIDPIYGRTVNENLAEYHVPVNADIGTIDVTVVGIPDAKFSPLGARGVGEIGITGAAAAVANAIYHATGKRVRDFPITPDKIMNA
ncbi:xanthine dehydrogenase family protein molybdopterin-binding subunit [Granulicella arctica]|uniref:xanthine dehydrogenase family protein molybdopterin-binding subunit n=1 Tax=Granulicella arctica TaxID=940613 RepID=UPI0021E026A5|nr:xanthine dehydrogenase family protein molybdopterin-binding subunit [Granulicella arctica]